MAHAGSWAVSGQVAEERRARCATRNECFLAGAGRRVRNFFLLTPSTRRVSTQAPLAVAVTLVFCGAAALACARRMLHKPGGDPGGAYARVGSSDVRRQSSLQENLLDDDDYKEDEPPESPSTTIRKRNLEMVERGGEFV